MVSLPVATIDTSVTDFPEPVVTSVISFASNLIGFQGDFAFDETVVTFDPDAPVQAAGLTGGTGANTWTVVGNVLDGPGPIRTLRVLGFVTNDFTPAGQGLGLCSI